MDALSTPSGGAASSTATQDTRPEGAQRPLLVINPGVYLNSPGAAAIADRIMERAGVDKGDTAHIDVYEDHAELSIYRRNPLGRFYTHRGEVAHRIKRVQGVFL